MGKTAAESHRILLEVYNEHALAKQTCRKWFARFKSGDFELDDKERPGQPKKFEDEELQGLFDVDSCQTLQELATSLAVDLSTLHDNARPHVAKPVKTYLGTLKWDVLPHPPYSPDIAPSDYHLFRSMARGLTDQKFTSYEDCQKWVDL
ncbi:Mariner Mos1 transposase [Eumeta japonica]|uniref:Mariner Mos1 transposase n=1 Tax=Eumeta variegata TaxID=151549 RepID=A0A4C1VP60_EUMVA|nr:Mariner Mos1 transposase [Eumeta japonica]